MYIDQRSTISGGGGWAKNCFLLEKYELIELIFSLIECSDGGRGVCNIGD